jgi:hypothetical protein
MYQSSEKSWKIITTSLGVRNNRNLGLTHRGFRDRCVLPVSPPDMGDLKILKNILSYFLKITETTAKFRFNRSIFFRKSSSEFVMSNHFFIFWKNCIKLQRKKDNMGN